MFIIFLDIDGVLLPYDNTRPAAGSPVEVLVNAFNKQALHHLHQFIEAIKEKNETVGIVISSDWRMGMRIEGLKHIFREHAFSNYIIGKTSDKKNFVDPDSFRSTRIRAWLLSHQHWGISNFTIIDDTLFGMEAEFPQHFVHCSTGVFSEKNAAEAIEVLNKGSMIEVEQTTMTKDCIPCMNDQVIKSVSNALNAETKEKVIRLIKTNPNNLLNISCYCCQTVVDWAGIFDRKDVAAFLIEICEEFKYTYHNLLSGICYPVHYMSSIHNLNAVKGYLIQHPEHLNAKDPKGLTPLCWAVLCGGFDVAEYLLSLNDIKVNITIDSSYHLSKEIHGKSLLDLAMLVRMEIFTNDNITEKERALLKMQEIIALLMKKGVKSERNRMFFDKTSNRTAENTENSDEMTYRHCSVNTSNGI